MSFTYARKFDSSRLLAVGCGVGFPNLSTDLHVRPSAEPMKQQGPDYVEVRVDVRTDITLSAVANCGKFWVGY